MGRSLKQVIVLSVRVSLGSLKGSIRHTIRVPL